MNAACILLCKTLLKWRYKGSTSLCQHHLRSSYIDFFHSKPLVNVSEKHAGVRTQMQILYYHAALMWPASAKEILACLIICFVSLNPGLGRALSARVPRANLAAYPVWYNILEKSFMQEKQQSTTIYFVLWGKKNENNPIKIKDAIFKKINKFFHCIFLVSKQFSK